MGSGTSQSCCPFLNVSLNEKKGCLLLKNPSQQAIGSRDAIKEVLATIFDKHIKKLGGTVVEKVDLDTLVGQTLCATV